MKRFSNILFSAMFWIVIVISSLFYLGILITNSSHDGFSSILSTLMNYTTLLAAIILIKNAKKFVEAGEKYSKTLVLLILAISLTSSFAVYSWGLLLFVISLIITVLLATPAIVFLIKGRFEIAKWFLLVWFISLALFPIFTSLLLLVASFD